MELRNDQDFLQNLAKKAQQDVQFKKNLLENPVAGIEVFLGKRIIIPQDKKVVIVDQTDPSTIFINLPAVYNTDDYNTDDVELDEEQLDIVAGGMGTPVIDKL